MIVREEVPLGVTEVGVKLQVALAGRPLEHDKATDCGTPPSRLTVTTPDPELPCEIDMAPLVEIEKSKGVTVAKFAVKVTAFDGIEKLHGFPDDPPLQDAPLIDQLEKL